jgi:trans-2,3-dihydro-3-hydroxyanthranilate isomerase
MRYLHFDVFTDTLFEGNQLAVCPAPPDGLTTDQMQHIANEMAFSETTFVFPKESTGAVKMRIFTPQSELPMAGHPTIGTTFALAREGTIEPGRKDFVFECGVGPVPVALEWDEQGLSFAWMTQSLPTFGPEVRSRQEFASAVGLNAADLADSPIEAVSCGVPFLFVQIKTRDAVDSVSIDRRSLRKVMQDAVTKELPTFFFTTDRTGASGDETVYSRMLAPDFGIAEDPATGGASGPLGCYLLRHGIVQADQARSILSLQGVAMKRPSRIYVSIESDDNAITRVRVGGKAVLVGEGTLRLAR